MKKKILAIVLARSGSRGLKNKNTKLFFRKPLICHTFETLKKAKMFDKIIISTDSKKCAKLAKRYNIEVPFLRPKKLSTNNSKAIDVIAHALKYIKNQHKKFDYVQYVMPTTPLKSVKDFRYALKLLEKKSADMVVSLCKFNKPKEWINPVKKDFFLNDWNKYQIEKKNRQDFKRNYYINGCIYLAKWDIFFKKKNWFAQKIFGFEMPRSRSIDIDNIEDFNEAKFFYKMKNK